MLQAVLAVMLRSTAAGMHDAAAAGEIGQAAGQPGGDLGRQAAHPQLQESYRGHMSQLHSAFWS